MHVHGAVTGYIYSQYPAVHISLEYLLTSAYIEAAQARVEVWL